MTPSQERQVLKNIKDLLNANAELDAKQEKDIKALGKRVKALELIVDDPKGAKQAAKPAKYGK